MEYSEETGWIILANVEKGEPFVVSHNREGYYHIDFFEREKDARYCANSRKFGIKEISLKNLHLLLGHFKSNAVMVKRIVGIDTTNPENIIYHISL